ncbi:DUF2514 family protein [Achromobacter piechaudii]|uniref:DUF2514 family protein n=1 Tax=Achromobacter piechaudii TaxID=72556 RepID=UPI003DA909E9
MMAAARLVLSLAGCKGYAVAALAGAMLVGSAAWTAQGWRYRAAIAHIERDHAKAREDQAQATVAAVAAVRTEERRRIAAVEKQRDDAQKMAAAAAGDAVRARAERVGLLKRADALAGAAAGRDPTLTDGSPAGADPVNLLAYMLGRVSLRAEELAGIADRAHISRAEVQEVL